MKQLNHQETPIKNHDNQIVLICDDVENADNIGMILRVADGFGVQKVMFKSETKELSKKSKRVSRSAYERIEFEFLSSLGQHINDYKEAGYHIVAVELTNESIDLRKFDCGAMDKIVIIIGNESRGYLQIFWHYVMRQ
ncbi:TrmH family RNA methyltransferase [Mangrovivirga cuniculi]|uniref:tRNA/rRNA methyltransferase SpoU type domain-containing protein n=1 Tax=Mangrovivirga cuniculi TaxID=2715131 RepID=A0A4D7JS79_9BACT|nr:TrmH family RNA methyltransferase [Mangrovivirga cuniculi]QCK16370.1 hypothetical protein DCC35_17325 [Mangrovivirga cuniculi]